MFSAIFFREKEIFKHYFWGFILSIFGNIVFILTLFSIFGNFNLNERVLWSTFVLISYLIIIIQSQIFCIIYNHHDRIEKIFEYQFLFFESRIFVILSRLLFIFALNILPIIVLYLFSNVQNNNIVDIALFILSIFLISLNNTSIFNSINISGGRFFSNFIQIFLIPLNLPIFILLNYNDNFVLIFFVIVLSFMNCVMTSYFNSRMSI